ncbi:Dabb family protein [Lewinella sp. IMCC34191]|uniref:Dabb family protein n=1 Tax=Lewinella sp. IMCC34191 TaxID=2259172 RepID=UPI000E2288D2|nr:Dabb family protein [Lewinella sp. IMCC34191]
MKLSALILLLAISLTACQEETTPPPMDNPQPEQSATESTPDSVLRHAVFFAFQDEATDEQITEVQQAFSNLPNEIEEIRGYEWGTNNSPENLNKGFTHAFFLTFHSEADRDAYLPHPAHQAFGQKLGPVLKDVFVVDYWARED